MAPRRLQVGSKTPQVCHYMRDTAVRWICRSPRWLQKAKMSVSPTRNTHFCKATQANLGPYWGHIGVISVPFSAPRSLQDGPLGLLLGSLGALLGHIVVFSGNLGFRERKRKTTNSSSLFKFENGRFAYTKRLFLQISTSRFGLRIDTKMVSMVSCWSSEGPNIAPKWPQGGFKLAPRHLKFAITCVILL